MVALLFVVTMLAVPLGDTSSVELAAGPVPVGEADGSTCHQAQSGSSAVDVRCPTEPPAPGDGRYVALGDSFSSGEGAPPFQPGTDRSGGACHRSRGAYPRLIEGTPGISRAEQWACSGAVVADLTSPSTENPGEIPQLDHISPPGTQSLDTTTVTLGIGGNDIGFPDIVGACLETSSWFFWAGNNDAYDETCRTTRNATTLAAVARLERTLPPALEEIRRRAPRANVYVVGYPVFMPTDPAGPCGGDVHEEDGSDRGLGTRWGFSKDNTKWMADIAGLLNAKLAEMTVRAGFVFIDTSDVMGEHGLCSSSSWMNGLVVDPADEPSNYSFHPNAAGQMAIAERVAGEIATGGVDLYIRSGHQQSYQYIVASGQYSFGSMVAAEGSDIELELRSPSGRVIGRSTTAPDVIHHLAPANESLTILAPEPGTWTTVLTARHVPDTGEGVRLRSGQLAATPDPGGI